MGYSASSAAFDTPNKIMEALKSHGMADGKMSHTWKYKGRTYFLEFGKEQKDLALTGRVMEVVPPTQKGGSQHVVSAPSFMALLGSSSGAETFRATFAGRVRIEPCGTVTAFPHIPRAIKKTILG